METSVKCIYVIRSNTTETTIEVCTLGRGIDARRTQRGKKKISRSLSPAATAAVVNVLKDTRDLCRFVLRLVRFEFTV